MNSGSSIKKVITVGNDKDFVRYHLTILNSLLPEKLTNREIDVLIKFITLDSSIISVDGLFGSTAKKVVRKNLNNMSVAQLSNIINSLVSKKFIHSVEGSDDLQIRSWVDVKPNTTNKSEPYNIVYSFKLEVNGNNE